MPAFTKRHYEAVANILCENDASPSLTSAFADFFQGDNPRFNTQRFDDWIIKCQRKRRGLSGRRRR